MQSDMFYQPHYVAYASAHGRAPEAQLADDGMQCAPFIIWMRAAYKEWAELNGHPRARDFTAVLVPADHERFARWLAERVRLTDAS